MKKRKLGKNSIYFIACFIMLNFVIIAQDITQLHRVIWLKLIIIDILYIAVMIYPVYASEKRIQRLKESITRMSYMEKFVELNNSVKNGTSKDTDIEDWQNILVV